MRVKDLYGIIVGVSQRNMGTARKAEEPHQKTDDLVPGLLGKMRKLTKYIFEKTSVGMHIAQTVVLCI